MQSALRFEAIVQPGHQVEVCSPELPEGATVEVIVVLPAAPVPAHGSALAYLESLPPGPRAFKTWEEYDRHLRQEKDSWER